MAKTELDIKKQKRKGKKRKHETQAAGSDDEVANKSVIVEEKPQVQRETQIDEEIIRKGKLYFRNIPEIFIKLVSIVRQAIKAQATQRTKCDQRET